MTTEDRERLLMELQAAQDHLAKCAGAIVRADHSLAHLMYQTGMQIKTLIERIEKPHLSENAPESDGVSG